jgi:hypothetical protein
MIEEREGSLNLVETAARGAPAIQNTTNKRKARSLVVPHIALEDTIPADEVQNVRAFGSENMPLRWHAFFAVPGDLTADFGRKTADLGRKSDAWMRHVTHRPIAQFGAAFSCENASCSGAPTAEETSKGS